MSDPKKPPGASRGDAARHFTQRAGPPPAEIRPLVPTILRISGYRIGFYQADLVEPCHVHVRRQSGEAKYWMDPIELADSKGFRPHELRDIERILSDHREAIVAAWLKVRADHDDGSSKN